MIHKTDPVTGVEFVRDTRRTTLTSKVYPGVTVVADLPGWYAVDPAHDDLSHYSRKDLSVRRQAIERLRLEYEVAQLERLDNAIAELIETDPVERPGERRERLRSGDQQGPK